MDIHTDKIMRDELVWSSRSESLVNSEQGRKWTEKLFCQRLYFQLNPRTGWHM